MKTITYIIITLLISLMLGCTKTTIKPPEIIKFNETPKYEIKELLEKLPKPTNLVPIYVKLINENKIQILGSSTGATHILLAPQEYAKVGAVVELTKTYKNIILEQEVLINTYVDQINSLKQLLEMERQKTINYFELWSTYQKLYEAEKWDHTLDNFINRGVIGVLGAGIILLIAL